MGPNDMISNLSGGNQQKLFLEKWLVKRTAGIYDDEPTRGIDVGANMRYMN